MFITFEGVEGSGKTTQILHTEAQLKNLGYTCRITKEPGGTRIGGNIRQILLDPENRILDPVTELLLYAADRRQHVKEVIRPALRSGKTVLCDRFHDSTVVYQGIARGLDMDLIHRLNRLALADIAPDLTFVLDLPPAAGLERVWRQVEKGTRSTDETRFENERLAFHEKVRQGYLELARQEPERVKIIDAAEAPELVSDQIMQTLERLLAGR